MGTGDIMIGLGMLVREFRQEAEAIESAYTAQEAFAEAATRVQMLINSIVDFETQDM